MRLNADLGEHFGTWQMGNDQAIMPYIDEANIACGYHAGDALVMQQTLSLAKQHKVLAGAHVSYPDIQGFGRRSMAIKEQELIAMIQAQIAVLEGLAKCQRLTLSHVKPHGALYNDMMHNESVFEAVVKALASYHCRYPLVIQALADNQAQISIAEKYKVTIVLEAFADRRYTSTGLLVSRQISGAVLNEQEALVQAQSIVEDGQVITACGSILPISAQTLCVHSDTPDAIELCKKISSLLKLTE
jgi:UPF0271 protein